MQAKAHMGAHVLLSLSFLTVEFTVPKAVNVLFVMISPRVTAV